MDVVRECDVVIAGAGPAGLAAALHLLHARPQLAGRVVAIEKATHPRVKVCAGGLIPRTVAALHELGLALDIPAVRVFGGTAQTEVGAIDLGASNEPLCTVVRRDQFDQLLASKAREAGLDLVEQTRVLDVEQHDYAVDVITQGGTFRAQALLGADGSGSRVRNAVFGRTKHNIGRALMADVAVNAAGAEEFVKRIYRFDFNCVAAGINGYCWSFPCVIGGLPHLNVGIYDQRPRNSFDDRSRPHLAAELRRAFPEVDLPPNGIHAWFKAFPIRWYDTADQYARGRTILAGDAAGVDPLMGEGISCAFEHGKLAAGAIARFLDGDRRALAAYGNELHRGLMGRKLRRLAFAARHFYGPRHRIFFRIASLSRKAQHLGVDWYNGARGADELSIRQALLKLCSSILFTTPLR